MAGRGSGNSPASSARVKTAHPGMGVCCDARQVWPRRQEVGPGRRDGSSVFTRSRLMHTERAASSGPLWRSRGEACVLLCRVVALCVAQAGGASGQGLLQSPDACRLAGRFSLVQPTTARSTLEPPLPFCGRRRKLPRTAKSLSGPCSPKKDIASEPLDVAVSHPPPWGRAAVTEGGTDMSCAVRQRQCRAAVLFQERNSCGQDPRRAPGAARACGEQPEPQTLGMSETPPRRWSGDAGPCCRGCTGAGTHPEGATSHPPVCCYGT